jgi:anti-sigma factor ChrR (cupin superfamily)
MLNCREVTEKASDYLEQTLSWQQRLSIRLHLLVCHHCRRYLRQLHAVALAVKQIPTPTVSEEAIYKQIEVLKKDFLPPDNH